MANLSGSQEYWQYKNQWRIFSLSLKRQGKKKQADQYSGLKKKEGSNMLYFKT
ncbi:MAG: hypothetical protein XE03_1475 [candidate division TA06 bacterium 34_109]|uniref:Uncharacterized protein n=1 Tax=candidate division TA06 bacterium 34_109 TaxID=1635277 RepID=A0A101I146_UNCT6|nr:MAG: hypothetical protein XE03_1475 [candidate division TA06 bacterium 34_109]